MKRFVYASEYIFSMSQSRKDVAAELEQITRPLVQHLIKLWLYPNSSSANHWKQEIYNLLHNVSRLRGTNKFPTSSFILKNTIDVNSSSIPIWVEIIQDDYDKVECSTPELVIAVKEYYAWLANKLSQQGEVSRTAIYNKLSELKFGDTV